MSSRIAQNTRGTLSFLLMIVYTAVIMVPLFLFAFAKLLSPTRGVRDVFRRALARLVETWIGLNTLLFALNRSTRWAIDVPDGLDREGCYLVASNHQSWVDILALQKAFNRRLPILRFFIKQELIWVPFLGAAWWALDFPFMRRPSREEIARNPKLKGKDLENARRACEKFRERPVAMMTFAEGTRFSAAKSAATNSPYDNLLKPKIGGIGIVLYALGNRLQSLIDVTIVYPDGPAKFWSMCCGAHVEAQVHVRQRAVEDWLTAGDYENDRDWRRRVQDWLGDIWQEKDELIQQTLDRRKPHD